MNIPINSKSAYNENYKMARASINTMLMPELPINDINNSKDSNILKINKNFFEKRIKSPTSAAVAYSEAINDMISMSDKKQIELYNSNMAKLKTNPQISQLIEQYNTTVEKAYPKTNTLREVLINENRFEIGKVKPKLNQLQKLKFALKYMY